MDNPNFYRIASASVSGDALRKAVEDGKNVTAFLYITGDFDYLPRCYVPMQISVELEKVAYAGDSKDAFTFTGTELEGNREFFGFLDAKKDKGWLEYKL